MKKLFFISILLFACFNSNAGNLKLLGSWSYAIDFFHKTVNVTGDRIEKFQPDGNMEVIKVKLLLTQTPFDGEKETGYVLSEYSFEPITNVGFYKNINKTSNCLLMPAPGVYKAIIIIEEFTATGYIITDYRIFDDDVKL